jgi:hypothetical protein
VTSDRQTLVIAAHAEYRAAGYRTIPVRLDLIVDSNGVAKKRPRFPNGTWKAAEASDLNRAVRRGYTDIAIVCDPPVVSLDFDERAGETEADVRARCLRVRREYGLKGAMVERTGHGFHIIARAPEGEWTRRIWGGDHPVCEARCGRDSAGNGLLLFVAPSWHPVAERFYQRAGPIISIDQLPECPRELLMQPAKMNHTPIAAARPSTNDRAGNAFEGDFRTLDVVALFRHAGMYVGEIRKQKHGVVCPWASSHTSGSDGTDTAIFVADTSNPPGFQCLHAHCAHRTMRDIRTYFGRELVDRFCAQRFVREDRLRGDGWSRPREWWNTEASA